MKIEPIRHFMGSNSVIINVKLNMKENACVKQNTILSSDHKQKTEHEKMFF